MECPECGAEMKEVYSWVWSRYDERDVNSTLWQCPLCRSVRVSEIWED